VIETLRPSEWERRGFRRKRRPKQDVVRSLEFECGCPNVHPGGAPGETGCLNGFKLSVLFPPCAESNKLRLAPL
jgi:hypothetical protein